MKIVHLITELARYGGSLGDGNDMDPNLVKHSTGFSMEPSDLVTIFLEDKVGSRFESKGFRGLFVCLKLKHGYNSSFSSQDLIVATLYGCDVFTRIIHVEL